MVSGTYRNLYAGLTGVGGVGSEVVTVSRPVSGILLVPVLYAGTMPQSADLAGHTKLTTARRFSPFLAEVRTI